MLVDTCGKLDLRRKQNNLRSVAEQYKTGLRIHETLARLHGRLSSRLQARLGLFLCFLINLGVRMHVMKFQRKLKHVTTLERFHLSTSAVLQNVGKIASRFASARTSSASPHGASAGACPSGQSTMCYTFAHKLDSSPFPRQISMVEPCPRRMKRSRSLTSGS